MQFPTWTSHNGRDDLVSDWQNNKRAAGTKASGATWTFRVNASKHNNETGEYITHIYAWDATGNVDQYGTLVVGVRVKDPTPFPDVPTGAWYADVVSRAVGLGLISGYSNGRFGPSDCITRGQAAVVLWNTAGRPAAGSGARSFPDVKSGDYFYRAVRWASGKSIVSGYANGKFGPKDNVTREQLAVMLANYAKNVRGRPVSVSAADYALMLDRASVSPWAVPAVGWCFRNKILSGSNGNVNPKGSATRAEAAKMVVGLHDLLA